MPPYNFIFYLVVEISGEGFGELIFWTIDHFLKFGFHQSLLWGGDKTEILFFLLFW